jgi:glycerate kinase
MEIGESQKTPEALPRRSRGRAGLRILIAPDKFKGSLGAEGVGARIAAGLRAALPDAVIEIVPLADGGEGTADAICRAGEGSWMTCLVHDALGRRREARYAWLESLGVAALDMSAAAGLEGLARDERRPASASTFGVGEMLLHATARPAAEIIIGLGGSATNDGGFGVACALGFRFLGADGRDLPGLVSALPRLARIIPPNDLKLPRIVAACDVRNPLLGPSGATNVFAAQKGATPEELEMLERALTQLADIAAQTFGRDHREVAGAGAAGGLGFGLMTFCDATVRSGFDVVAKAIDLRRKVERADIVITGEGKLDRQTLAGKAPAGLARMARELKKPVYVIAGQATDDAEVRQLFDGITTLDDTSPDYCDTPQLLEIRARELALRLR